MERSRALASAARVRYIGKSFADIANTLVVPSVVLGDATVHYEWQNWRGALNVINVADTIYVASCASEASCFYGDRRRVDGEPSPTNGSSAEPPRRPR
jgi:iron complex outermembrane receptor protein